MKNTEALEQRITAAEKELTEMRELLKQEEIVWKPEDIQAGVIVTASDHSKSVVLSCGYGVRQTPLFYLGGFGGNPLIAFSTMSGVTAREMAQYFNDGNVHTKVGSLDICF